MFLNIAGFVLRQQRPTRDAAALPLHCTPSPLIHIS